MFSCLKLWIGLKHDHTGLKMFIVTYKLATNRSDMCMKENHVYLIYLISNISQTLSPRGSSKMHEIFCKRSMKQFVFSVSG